MLRRQSGTYTGLSYNSIITEKEISNKTSFLMTCILREVGDIAIIASVGDAANQLSTTSIRFDPMGSRRFKFERFQGCARFAAILLARIVSFYTKGACSFHIDLSL